MLNRWWSNTPSMEASRLRIVMKKLISHTRHLHSNLRRLWNFDSSATDESAVYKHALKFQRPTTVKYKDHPINSASFIGTIISPLKIIKTRRLGIHTMLKGVISSPNSARSFTILMKMWDEMAEISLQHLKVNDFVYVWGPLGSYIKPDQNGIPRLLYEVDVKEINFVAWHDQGSKLQGSEKSPLSAEDRMERHRNKLHLWQVFFSSPHEWRDCRKSKKNPSSPDFKHKDTGESLWLNPRDPPWIKSQLQLLDSRLAEQGLQYYGTSTSSLSPFIYDDIEKL